MFSEQRLACELLNIFRDTLLGGRWTVYDNVIENACYPFLDHKMEPPRHVGCVRDLLIFLAHHPRNSRHSCQQTSDVTSPRQQTSHNSRQQTSHKPDSSISHKTQDIDLPEDESEGLYSHGPSRLFVLEMYNNTYHSIRSLLRRAPKFVGFPVIISQVSKLGRRWLL